MHIAALTAADLDAYRRLMLHAFTAAADAFTNTAEDRANAPDEWWLSRIADPAGASVAFGAFDEGELAGTVTIEFVRKPKTRHRALVLGMFVREQSRGRGLGRRLMRAALGCAAQREGVLTVVLTVTEGNVPAINLYRACGFNAFGTEPMAIATPDGYKGKVHMWRRLEGPDDPTAMSAQNP